MKRNHNTSTPNDNDDKRHKTKGDGIGAYTLVFTDGTILVDPATSAKSRLLATLDPASPIPIPQLFHVATARALLTMLAPSNISYASHFTPEMYVNILHLCDYLGMDEDISTKLLLQLEAAAPEDPLARLRACHLQLPIFSRMMHQRCDLFANEEEAAQTIAKLVSSPPHDLTYLELSQCDGIHGTKKNHLPLKRFAFHERERRQLIRTTAVAKTKALRAHLKDELEVSKDELDNAQKEQQDALRESIEQWDWNNADDTFQASVQYYTKTARSSVVYTSTTKKSLVKICKQKVVETDEDGDILMATDKEASSSLFSSSSLSLPSLASSTSTTSVPPSTTFNESITTVLGQDYPDYSLSTDVTYLINDILHSFIDALVPELLQYSTTCSTTNSKNQVVTMLNIQSILDTVFNGTELLDFLKYMHIEGNKHVHSSTTSSSTKSTADVSSCEVSQSAGLVFSCTLVGSLLFQATGAKLTNPALIYITAAVEYLNAEINDGFTSDFTFEDARIPITLLHFQTALQSTTWYSIWDKLLTRLNVSTTVNEEYKPGDSIFDKHGKDITNLFSKRLKSEEMFKAIEADNLPVAKFLSALGAEPSKKLLDQAMWKAIQDGNLPTAKFLLALGAEPSMSEDPHFTSIEAKYMSEKYNNDENAYNEDNWKNLDFMLEVDTFYSSLMLAIANDRYHPKMLPWLLDIAGVDINLKQSVLHGNEVARCGGFNSLWVAPTEKMQFLLSRGIDPNQACVVNWLDDECGEVPREMPLLLMSGEKYYSSKKEREDQQRLLIRNGANPNSFLVKIGGEEDVPSVTKAYWPSVLKNTNVSSIYKQFINDGEIDFKWCEELLVKHGANPNWPIGVDSNEKGETPCGMTVLIRAVLDGNLEVARLLLKHGADPNQYERPCPGEDDYFYYPLASKEDQMFQQGLTSYELYSIGLVQCPLSIALKTNNKNMISLLKKHGATADTSINNEKYYSINPQCIVAINLNSTTITKLAAKKWGLMTENMKHDKKLILFAVKEDYRALEYASDELKNDREIVMVAVQQDGGALEYASDELKNDKEIDWLL